MNLLDTLIIIELIRQKRYEVGAISVITLIEVLRGIGARKRYEVKGLLEESFEVLNLDNKTIEIYCNLYQKLKSEGKSIPDADLLIAATAIACNMTLKTRDEHFERLKKLGLKLTQTNKAIK